MRNNQWVARLAAGALVSVTLLGVALAAGQQGTQNDPLVTLSYLTGKATPEIMAQLDAKLAAREQALVEQWDAAMATYSKKMEDKLSAAGGGSKSVSFTVVDLKDGQKLTAGVGCEIMLRAGSAVAFAAGAPALVNTTDGGDLWAGSTLVQNHLYMATVEGHGITASGSVKLLVRGSYTLS